MQSVASKPGAEFRVGLVGTGFIARHFFEAAQRAPRGFTVTGILSRRPREASGWVPAELHTRSIEALADDCDAVFDATGDASFAADIALALLARGMPLVTANCEFHVSVGSYFARRMFVTEADGDQPAAAASLHAEALSLGFRPLAHVNFKNFLDHNPSPASMTEWSARQGIRLQQVVSFTDGSKLQLEQALTANGLGLGIAQPGLIGGRRESPFDLSVYADAAEALGRPIADFAQAAGAPPGIALVADHPEIARMRDHMAFRKLHTPDERFVVLIRGYHLVHLEAIRTLDRLAETPRADWRPIVNNGERPTIGVAAVAKRPLRAGEAIAHGFGGFETRGVAIPLDAHPDHVPICLLNDAVLRRDVEPGQIVVFDDVTIAPTPALDIHLDLMREITRRESATTE